jgi:putative PIN family toxin of toxin-antitoxin system
MITAVVDTNVLASGFASSSHSSLPAQIIDAWRAGSYTLVVSEHILDELERTLLTPYFRRRLTLDAIAADCALLRRQAIVADLTVNVSGVATHPEDDLILATAVSAHTDYLVTGDTRLQKVGSYEGVRIVSPRDFLDILSPESAR